MPRSETFDELSVGGVNFIDKADTSYVDSELSNKSDTTHRHNGEDITPSSVDSSNSFNNIIRIEKGDDWQARLDTASNGDIVRAYSGVTYDFANTTLPITVPSGVVLDISGTHIAHDGDYTTWFYMSPNSVILTHGSYLDPTNLTGSVFMFDGDVAGSFGTREPAYVLGYGTVVTHHGGFAVEFQEFNGASVSACHAELTLRNCGSAARFRSNSGLNGAYVNNNSVYLRGRAGQDERLIRFAGNANHNVAKGEQLQVADSCLRVGSFEGGNYNRVVGDFADPRNATNPVVFASGAGDHNLVDIRYRLVEADVTYDGGNGNSVSTRGLEGQLPQNLAGQTGSFVGQKMMDDGTNTSTGNPMECVWIGSSWQPSDGGSTFQ